MEGFEGRPPVSGRAKASRRFWDKPITACSLKVSVKNCGQISADKGMVAADSLQGVASALYNSTLYDFPFSHSTTRLGFGIP